MTSFMPSNQAPQQNPYYARKRMPSAHSGQQAHTETGVTLTPLHRYRSQRAEQQAQQLQDSRKRESKGSRHCPEKAADRVANLPAL